MNADTIVRLLTNSGFHNVRVDPDFVYMEDPSCILRGFETFINYAWMAIVFLTGLMLTGWAISMIRGAKTDFFINLRNLIILFGVLTLTKPMINLIYGDDLFARGCRTIAISATEINSLLDMRNAKLKSRGEYDLYEYFNIYDSGVVESVASFDMNNEEFINVKSESISENVSLTSGISRPVRAFGAGIEVIVISTDNRRYIRSGGTRAWRNNNPGNIRFGDFARSVGAIGEAGGFAVFPDEIIGLHAIKTLLLGGSYRNLTIADAISRYAPPSENDTTNYQRRIEQLTGLSINRRIFELTDEELDRVVYAIKQIEGWKPGTIKQIEGWKPGTIKQIEKWKPGTITQG